MEYEQFLKYRFCDGQEGLKEWWNSELSKLICKFFQFSTEQGEKVDKNKCAELHKEIFTRVSAPLADSMQKQFPQSLKRVGISDDISSTTLKQLIECFLKRGCKQGWEPSKDGVRSNRVHMPSNETAFPGLTIPENNQLASVFHKALQEWPDDHDYDECQRILMENNQTTRVTNKALRFMIGYEALLIYYLKNYFPPEDMERREENPLFGSMDGFLDGFLPGFYSGICDTVTNKLYREGEKIEETNNESVLEKEPHAMHLIMLMKQLLQALEENSLSSAVKLAIFSKLCHLRMERSEKGRTQDKEERQNLCQSLRSKLNEIGYSFTQEQLESTLSEFESYAAEQKTEKELGCGSRGRPSLPLSGCRSYMWGRTRFAEPVRDIWAQNIDGNSSLGFPAELLTDPLPSHEDRARSKFYRIRSTYSILAVQGVPLVASIEAIIHEYISPEVHLLARKVIKALEQENRKSKNVEF